MSKKLLLCLFLLTGCTKNVYIALSCNKERCERLEKFLTKEDCQELVDAIVKLSKVKKAIPTHVVGCHRNEVTL